MSVTVRVDGCPGMRFTLVALTTIAYSGSETVMVWTVDVEGASFASPP
jgi:hypothetical protein